MKFENLPAVLQTRIILNLCTKDKLEVSKVSRQFRSLFFTCSQPNSKDEIGISGTGVWKEADIFVSSGARTVPFLRKLAGCVQRLNVHFEGSDACATGTVFASFPDMPGVQELNLTGDGVDPTDADNHRQLVSLGSKYTNLRRLSCPTRYNMEGEDVLRVPRAVPSLHELSYTGVGCWTVESAEDLRNGLRVLEALPKVSLGSIQLCDVGSVGWDCLAGSRAIAVRLPKLELYETLPPAGPEIFRPRASLEAFPELESLSLAFESEHNLSVPWLSTVKILSKLEYLSISFCPQDEVTPEGPLEFFGNAECLPLGLRSIDIFFGRLGTEVVMSLAQRLKSLKHICLTTDRLNYDVYTAVTSLVNPESSVEYLYVNGRADREVNALDTFQRIYQYLLEVELGSCAPVSLLHLDTGLFVEDDPAEDVEPFSLIGCNPAALVNRFADPSIIRLGKDAFTTAEAETIRTFEGWHILHYPDLDQDD